MKKTNTFNLTYAEGFLLSTQSLSAYTLHQQYSILMEQNNIIKNLSCDLGRLKDELTKIKSTNTQTVLQVSAKTEEAVSTLGLPYSVNPKIILGFIGTGVLYFYVVPALSAKLALPTLKSFLIPIKSAVIGLIPFIEEERIIEFIKEGCSYRLKLVGDQVSCLEARRADSKSFKPVSDLINKPDILTHSTTQSANPLPPSVPKTTNTEPSAHPFTETAADLVTTTPSAEAAVTPSVESAAVVTEHTLTMLSSLG